MKGIKKHLVALLSTVLMMTSLGIAPALADDAPLGNDDFNIVVNKKLNPKDLTLDLKIKLEDKDPTTPKVVNDLSQVFKDEGKEKEKLDLVKDKTDEYEMVVSENGEVEFELNYSKEVKAAEGEAEAINRDEKHSFKVNVTEIEEAKAEEPKVEEPKAEEPKVEEHEADEDVVDEPKASADGSTRAGQAGLEVLTSLNAPISLDAKDTNPINIEFEALLSTATVVYQPKLVIDYSAAKIIVNKKSFNHGTDIASVSDDPVNKKITVVFKEPFSGRSTIDFDSVLRLNAQNGDSYKLKATFSGFVDSAKTIAYEPKTIETAAINVTGVSNDLENATPTSVATWNKTAGAYTYDQVAGTNLYNRSFRPITKPSGAKNLYFENLIIKRTPNDGRVMSVMTNRSGGLNSKSSDATGKVTTNNNSVFVSEYGEQNLDSFVYYEDTFVQSNVAAGPVTTTYEVYNGTQLVFTFTRTVNVKHTSSLWQKGFMTSSKVNIGETVVQNLTIGATSGPKGITDIEYITNVPAGFKPREILTKDYSGIDKVSYEVNNSGVYVNIPREPGFAKRFLVPDVANITSIKFESATEYNTISAWSYTTVTFENLSVGEGSQVNFGPKSLSYKNTQGQTINYWGSVAPDKYLVKGGSGSSQSNPSNLSANVLNGTAYWESKFPTQPVTSLKTTQQVRMMTSGGAAIKNPYIYVIVPKGVNVQSYFYPLNSGMSFAPDGSNHLNDPRMYEQGVERFRHSLQKASLNDQEDIYFTDEIENEALQGYSASEQAYLNAHLAFTSSNIEAGDYTIKFGVGSRENADFVEENLAGGMTKSNLDSNIKNTIKSKNNVVYTTAKNFTIKRVDGVQALSWSKGELDSDYILTGSGISTTMVNKTVDYKYEITNTSTTNFDKFEVIEVLPHLGDSFIINSGARNSEYGINYSGAPITATINGATSNIKVQYALTYNPDRFDSNANDVVWKYV